MFWFVPTLLHLNHYTKDCEKEGKQYFTYTRISKWTSWCIYWHKRVTKAHIPVENAPKQIEIPKVNFEKKEITTHMKRGRLLDSTNKYSQKRKEVEKQNDLKIEECVSDKIHNERNQSDFN